MDLLDSDSYPLSIKLRYWEQKVMSLNDVGLVGLEELEDGPIRAEQRCQD
jgi:hypothetical protein